MHDADRDHFTSDSPSVPYAFAQWRFDIMRHVYEAGIQVFPDYHLQLVDIIFVVCPMNTVLEAQLAFAVLREKVQGILEQIHKNRVALLVDIAGLTIGSAITPSWGAMLKGFLQEVCLEKTPGTGQFLNARYNSATDAALTPQQRAITIADRMRNIHIMSEAAALNMQTNIVGSRQEAIALVTVLREEQRHHVQPYVRGER